ncbi:hypothetical protein PR202_gb00191 [Eleusine coracana subsp. coracana]|uniref:WW domain-containing protein n=1 Tax=Eleusine coracana subsp. coracana TaxID=191504 RepID=A0AAV5DTN6_ELECO|nr:hypothetical protein PR202_gb00191 [Eleusine coracana subsp. coracana]
MQKTAIDSKIVDDHRVPESEEYHQGGNLRKRMEMQPELSLGPTWPPGWAPAMSSSSESDGSSRKKRKHYLWEEPPPMSHGSLDLQLYDDPLPLDWEQCLDLQSGKMYYLNRKTLKKSWTRPREQSVNLDLNMSTIAATDISVAAPGEEEQNKPDAMTSGGNMVAGCANCHLLVMLSKFSPSCPNCKFVQPLASATSPQPVVAAYRRLDAAVKPLETLSLLH